MKKSNFKLIIFDLDGTLIDSIPYHAKAFVEVCKRQGIHVPQTEIDSLMGKNSKSIFEYLIKKYGLKGNIEELRTKRRKICNKLFPKRDLSFPGVMHLLKNLKKKKYKLAIGTGTSHKTFLVSTTKKLRKLFDFTSTSYDVKHGKPSPEQMFLILKKMKMQNQKHKVLVVGDSIFDAMAAKRAGLKFIGVRTGFKKGKPLEKCKHLAIVNSVKDLDKVL